MSDLMLTNYFNDGTLVRILPEWSANRRDIFMIYNHKDHLPEKLRLLIDFISQFKHDRMI